MMKSMRKYNMFFLLLVGCNTVATKNDTKITRYIHLDGDTIKKQVVFIRDTLKKYEINYANNGWQVLDSNSYEYLNDSSYYLYTYHPQYDIDTRVLKKYALHDKIKYQKNSRIHFGDEYNLSDNYSRDLDFLFKTKLNPNHDNKLIFHEKIVPSLLIEYGIPYNEILDSCKYKVTKNGLLSSDDFYFANYSVTRKYNYVNSTLKKVIISVKDKLHNEVNEYVEEFR